MQQAKLDIGKGSVRTCISEIENLAGTNLLKVGSAEFKVIADGAKQLGSEIGTAEGKIKADLRSYESVVAAQLLVWKESHGKAYNPKVNFVRYADDFIITGCSKELLENEVKPLVERFMFERGLQLRRPVSRISNRASTSWGRTCADMAANS